MNPRKQDEMRSHRTLRAHEVSGCPDAAKLAPSTQTFHQAAEQPAEAMPAGASSADTAAGLSAPDQPSASSSSAPRSVLDALYEKAVRLKHLATSIDVAGPLHSQQAAASWKGDALELAKLTFQLARCVGTDFPSHPDNIDPLELACQLAKFCETKFAKTSTSLPAPAPEAAAAIAPARISAAVRHVSSVSSQSRALGGTAPSRRGHCQRQPSRLGPAGDGSGA